MSVSNQGRVSGGAAAIGGLCWLLKSGLILLTGEQPLLLFEVAPAFFAIAIVGLAGRVNGQSGLARAGAMIAIAGGVAALLNSVREVFIAATGMVLMEIELISIAAGFGWLFGLLFVGISMWRRQTFSGRWRLLPVLLAVVPFPMIILLSIVGEAMGLAPAVGERLIEIPLLLLGLGWMALGWHLVFNSKHIGPANDV